MTMTMSASGWPAAAECPSLMMLHLLICWHHRPLSAHTAWCWLQPCWQGRLLTACAALLQSITCYHGQDQLKSFVSSCHVLVCLLPLTNDTRGGSQQSCGWQAGSEVVRCVHIIPHHQLQLPPPFKPGHTYTHALAQAPCLSSAEHALL